MLEETLSALQLNVSKSNEPHDSVIERNTKKLHRLKNCFRLPHLGRILTPLFLLLLSLHAQAAFNLTLSTSATMGVTTTLAANITTYTATATGANLNWVDVRTALEGGKSVVIDSGSAGAEAGNITSTTNVGFPFATGNQSLTIQTGSGPGLVGDITLRYIAMNSGNTSIIIRANRNVVTGDMYSSGPSSVIPVTNVSITALTGSINMNPANSGALYTNQLTLDAATGIGTSSTPLSSAASTLSATNRTVGDVYIADGLLAPLSLIASKNDAPAGTFNLRHSGTLNINGSVVGNGTGGVTLTTTGSNNDINYGGAGYSNALNGTLTLNSTGKITHAGSGDDIRAATVALNSISGIGTSAARLQMSAESVSGTNSASGDVFLTLASNGFTTTATSFTNSALNGNITIARTGGTSLTANNVTANGNINVSTDGANLTMTGITATGANRDVTAVATGSGSITAGSVNTTRLATLTAGGAILDDTNAATRVGAASLALTASTGIGTQTNLLGTTVSNLEAQTGSGGVFIDNTGSLTVGGVNGALSGIHVTGANGGIRLSNNNSITFNEGTKSPGNLTIQATGSTSDIVTQHSVVRGISSSGGTLSVQAGRDIIIGGSNGFGDAAGQTATFNAARDMLIQATSYVEANGGPLSATVGRNFTISDALGSGSIFNNNTGGQPISITTGSNGIFSALGTLGGVGANSGPISISADDMVIQSRVDTTGIVTLQQLTAGRQIDLGSDTSGALGLTSAEINRITAGTLRIGRTDIYAHLNVSGAIAPSGTSRLILRCGASISQFSGTSITEDNLAFQVAGAVSLPQANNADTLAVQIIGYNAYFEFRDSNGLTVGEVDGITGITTNNGPVILNTGNSLTLNSPVSAGTGIVTLGSGGGYSAGAAGSVTGSTVVFGDDSTTGRIWVVNGSSIMVDSASPVPYTASNLRVGNGSGNDTFNVTPSSTVSFTINGGSGTDTLTPDYTGTTNPAINPTTPGSGSVTFGNRVAIIYNSIENVTPNVNAAPVNTVPGAQTIAEDSTLTFSSANSNTIQVADNDANTNPMSVTLAVTNGSITLSHTTGLTFGPGDGTADATMTFEGTLPNINAALNGFTYTPNSNYNGTDTLTVTTNDLGNTGSGGAKEDIDTVSINITEVNDAPVASDDNLTPIRESSGARTIPFADLLVNDSKGAANESGQTLTITAVSNAVGGSVTLGTSAVTFLPDLTFNGTAGFDYTIRDNGTTNGADDFQTDTGHVGFTIWEVNDLPVPGQDDLGPFDEDSGPRLIPFSTLLANDVAGPANENGQSLTITAVTMNVGGTVTLGTGANVGNVIFTPTPNLNGRILFNYTLQDNGTTNGVDDFKSSPGTAFITITPVNDQPVATNDSVSTDEGSALDIDLRTRVSDIETADADLTYTLVTGPTASEGTVAPTGTRGEFHFTPATDFNGTTSFTYLVRDTGDPAGTPGNRVDSDVKTITINVTSINDEPTLDIISNPAPVLEDSRPHNMSLTGIGAGVANESKQALTVTANSSNTALIPTPVVTYISPDATGTLTYTPAANQNGTATITVTVQDNGGTVNGGVDTTTETFTVTVNAVNDAPSFIKGANQAANEDVGAQTVANFATAISPGPADESRQTVSFTSTNDNNSLFSVQPVIASNGTLTYTPAANANGVATVTVTLKDNGGTANGGIDTSAAQTFPITVNPGNDAPVAADQRVSTDEDTPKAITLAATDIDNTSLTYSVVTQPRYGTLSGTAPNLTYTPNSNYNGADSFIFKANDGTTDSNTAIITINVGGSNDAPVAVDDSYTVDGAGLTITAPGVLGNDIDADGDTLTAAIASQPTNGTVTLNADGSFTYTPVIDSSGPDSFTYTMSDGTSTDTGTVNLSVENAPQSPKLAMTLDQTSFNENAGPAAALVTLTRNAGLANRLSVQVVSSNTREARVPATVEIPSGAKSVQFWISAVDDGIRDGNKTVTIAATATNFPRITSSVQVLDNGLVRLPLQLRVQPAGFVENAGAKASIGEVSIPTAAKVDYAIELVSSDESEVRVPKTVTIKAGATRATFYIGAIDDNIADGTQVVYLTAKRLGFGTASTTLKVGDNETRSLLLTTESETVREGGFVLATVTRNWALNSEMTVLVQNTNSNAVQVANAVTIPAGATSANFPIYGVANTISGDTRSATITVNRPGLTSDSTAVDVIDRVPLASFGAASRIGLSTASANSALQSVSLQFAGGLNADAINSASFTVLSNGMPVTIEGVSHNAATNTLTLLLADGSLNKGDHVDISWSGLLDARGAATEGQVSRTAQ